MFGSNKKEKVSVNDISIQNFEVLMGSNSNFCGNMQAKGAVRIDGIFSGLVVAESDVLIGPTGTIQANIFADNITIAGKVTGNIVARGTLELLASAVLVGDVKASNLVVEPGAALRGKVEGVEELDQAEVIQQIEE